MKSPQFSPFQMVFVSAQPSFDAQPPIALPLTAYVVFESVGVKVTELALDESQASTPESAVTGQVPLNVDLVTCSLCTNCGSALAPHAGTNAEDSTTNAVTPTFLPMLIQLLRCSPARQRDSGALAGPGHSAVIQLCPRRGGGRRHRPNRLPLLNSPCGFGVAAAAKVCNTATATRSWAGPVGEQARMKVAGQPQGSGLGTAAISPVRPGHFPARRNPGQRTGKRVARRRRNSFA